ncbi:endo-1,3;1,4-beta-D-glucanase-like [Mercurialis annua]|uniref:endo-1,3;1,4-beta-D-glucanase-like n=1 Tax=Mercurialis annua TaxID=3986 RepID=UPI00215F5863|nr:endo-1,3;1,4-beta-D-glucanase-like [Mercurialis annua]XP_055960788.1 endo-1,3;1,4-beta-D-glucanase-like [Mercurialis annua]
MSGPQCCDNPPTLNRASGSGHVEELGGLDSYVTGPSDSNSAILLVSDVFGYEAPNLRKLADKVAADGFCVVVPDFIRGDPYAPDDKERPIQVWLKDHEPVKGSEDAKKVIAALKSRGISAVGAAGFCWGGMVVVKLASSDDIQAAVILHPGWITADEINAVRVPTAILGAETDQISPPEQMKQFGEILAAKPEFESYVKIFDGAVHGWTLRYNDDEDSAIKKAEEAHSDLLNWFTKFVK